MPFVGTDRSVAAAGAGKEGTLSVLADLALNVMARRKQAARSASVAGRMHSRTGDPDVGEFADAVVLFKAGEVPEDAVMG